MEENLGFQDTVAQSLRKKGEYLETVSLPKLKELLRVFHSSFVGIYNVLLKKGLIHEDPYKYDQKISEVTVPSDEPFNESGKTDQLSLRLSAYESQLEFLTQYYQFGLDFLTLKRIRELVAFVRYIRWDSLSATSPFPITRVFAECLDKVKMGSDTLSSGIVMDAQSQNERNAEQILGILKELALYQRERYKQELREKILPMVQIDPASAFLQKQEHLKAIKRRFAMEFGDRPFYPELAEEVFNEAYSPEAEELKAEILKKLEVKDRPAAGSQADTSFRQILLEAVRALSASGIQMDTIIRKISDNNTLLKAQKMSLIERLRAWLLKTLRGDDQSQMYELQYFDTATSTTKTERLDFVKFLAEVTQKSRLFAALGVRNGSAYRKLETAHEEQVFRFLTRHYEEMQLIFRRLTSLDAFFKSESPRVDRQHLHGIKLELNSVKNGLMKANQKRHEYIARREEAEQMKKLGIMPISSGDIEG